MPAKKRRKVKKSKTRRNPSQPRRRASPAFHQFFKQYVETALWSSTDDDGQSLDIFRMSDIEKKTLRQMEKDCIAFMRENREDIAGDYGQAGHDFWLTRNRHGAGFWDGDWPEAAAKRLTKSAHAYGSYDLMYDEESSEIYGYP